MIKAVYDYVCLYPWNHYEEELGIIKIACIIYGTLSLQSMMSRGFHYPSNTWFMTDEGKVKNALKNNSKTKKI